MAAVIDMYMRKFAVCNAIYHAGSDRIQKAWGSKTYGRHFLSAGGILARKYPERVFAITFHKERNWWLNEADFLSVEQLFLNHGRSLALDTDDPRLKGLRIGHHASIAKDGEALDEAYDGYIILNRDADYRRCTLIHKFYGNASAKVVWSRLRQSLVGSKTPMHLHEAKFAQALKAKAALLELVRADSRLFEVAFYDHLARIDPKPKHRAGHQFRLGAFTIDVNKKTYWAERISKAEFWSCNGRFFVDPAGRWKVDIPRISRARRQRRR
jgi:hypothetical protein